jgi:hypothetical protein
MDLKDLQQWLSKATKGLCRERNGLPAGGALPHEFGVVAGPDSIKSVMATAKLPDQRMLFCVTKAPEFIGKHEQTPEAASEDGFPPKQIGDILLRGPVFPNPAPSLKPSSFDIDEKVAGLLGIDHEIHGLQGGIPKQCSPGFVDRDIGTPNQPEQPFECHVVMVATFGHDHIPIRISGQPSSRLITSERTLRSF